LDLAIVGLLPYNWYCETYVWRRAPMDKILPDIPGPLYRKLIRHIENLIAAGELQVGERLPSSREFAAQLGVSRNTVVNAFEELQARGVLTSFTGKGTFVARSSKVAENLASQSKVARPQSLDTWEAKLSKRMEAFRDPAQDRFYRYQSRRDIIYFSRGTPPEEFFPVEDLRRVVSDVLRTTGSKALQYAPPGGVSSLRQYVARRLSLHGAHVTDDEVLITNGSQQAIDLVAKTFLDPGDSIAIEAPVYSGAINLYNLYQVRQIPVEVGEEGMRIDLLGAVLRGSQPKFVHTTPTFQNPTGSTMPLEKRRELLELVYENRTPVIEDDFVGELRFEGVAVPSLRALDTKGTVLQLGTFSKICFPGVRIGWIISDQSLIERMRTMKQFSDLGASALLQEAIAEFCRRGLLDKHLKRMKRIYMARRNVMLETLHNRFPEGVTWHRPQGGMSVWVNLPEGLDVAELLVEARNAGVDFAAGPLFYPNPNGQSSMRLNFTCVSESEIEEGLNRLSGVIKAMLTRVSMRPRAGEEAGHMPVV
jgi:GntR family transcriptional regulator/MocR family aminotransferase